MGKFIDSVMKISVITVISAANIIPVLMIISPKKRNHSDE